MEVRGQLHDPAALPQGKVPPVIIRLEAGWAPESVWDCGENSLLVPGIEPRFLDNPSHNLVTLRTELSWLRKEVVVAYYP
jgi:hypothetical protein